MGRKRGQRSEGKVDKRLPLPQERQERPRFDGNYVSADDAHRASFSPSGMVVFDGEQGRWHVQEGLLSLETSRWSGEGAVGPVEVVLAVLEVSTGRRVGAVLAFVEDGAAG